MPSRRLTIILFVLFIFLQLSACQADFQPAPTSTPIIPTEKVTLAPTRTSPPAATGTASPTPVTPTLTTIPTSTATPFVSASRLPVLEYHDTNFRLSDSSLMQTDWFVEQMRWLAENGYYTLSAREIADFLDGAPFPQKSVALTFNIGTAERDDYANVILPTLHQYGLKATIFLLVNESVVVDECGSVNRFCWSELKAWQDEGLVTFQAHGRTHVSYPKASKALVKADAGECKAIIEEKLGSSVFAFAYPSDAPSPHAFPIIESLGYLYALAGNTRSDRTVLPNDPQRYDLPRLYPYSNPSIYPILTGSDGLTFQQMMEVILTR